MRLRIRKVCKWIVFIQIMCIVIHLSLYTSVDDVQNSYSRGDNSLFRNHAPVTIVNASRTFNRHSTTNKINAGDNGDNQSGPKSRNVTQRPNINVSTYGFQMAIESKQLELKGSNLSVYSQKRKGRPVYTRFQKCPDIEFPKHLDQSERWQSVDNRTAFVFSAYFVEKGKKLVIPGAKTMHRQIYFCIIWNNENRKNSAEQASVSVKQLPEGHNMRYSAVLFECSLATNGGIPSHVTLVTNRCGSPNNLLKVHMTTKPMNYARRFTVCLTPLNTNYSRAYELVEWIELNRILGAEKFVIYNHTSADNIVSVLDYYRKQGLVEIVQWQLPIGVRTFNGSKLPEIHYFGQIIALQDCLYRNKADSEFIVNIDLDEFIIPRGNNVNNWNDMLGHLSNNAGAYIVRNTFFRKEWKCTYFAKKEKVDKYGLITLKKLHHEEEIFHAKRRSKYFARTEIVYQVMIHDVISLPKMNIAKTVPIETGLLYHYRDWENEFKLPKVRVFDDTIPRKFGETLIKDVENVWSTLVNVRMNIPPHL